MSATASQIIGVIVCSAVCSGAEQRKHQSSASLVFVRGIHRWPVDSPHKGPVTRTMFPSDDIIMVFPAYLHWQHLPQWVYHYFCCLIWLRDTSHGEVNMVAAVGLAPSWRNANCGIAKQISPIKYPPPPVVGSHMAVCNTGLKLENYYFFTFTFSRPEVRKLLRFYFFSTWS